MTTSGAARVAGRSAYELVLTPRDAGLAGGVGPARHRREQHVPLRVQVFAKGSTEPAFEVAFTPVDFSRPDAAQFAFNPPPGTKVTERTLPAHPGTEKMGMAHPDPEAAPSTAAGEPKVVGKGWGSVVVATVPPQSQSGSGDQQSLKAHARAAAHGSRDRGARATCWRASCSPRSSPTTAASPSAP